MFTLRRGVFATRAMMPSYSVALARAQFAVTRRTMELDSASVQAPANELPSGHIVKFVKVHPALKHLVRGPQGETLRKLQEDTYTSIAEKYDGFEATGIPYDLERLEAGIRQLLGAPVPTEWMREYQDLVDANVLLRPKYETRKNKEGASVVQEERRYFFLAKTKAMYDLLDNVVQMDVLQKETNVKVTYEPKQLQIFVRLNGTEANVRNAFCKLLTTVRAYTQYASTRLEVLRNQHQLAGVQIGYWRAKAQFLDGTCVDRSATKRKVDGMERTTKQLEAKAQRLQLKQELSEQSIPEATLMRDLYDPRIEETKAQLRAMEAKVEESKKLYQEAMKTAKGDPHSDAGPGHEDQPSSAGLTTVRACTEYPAIQLKIVKSQHQLACVQTAYWRAKLELLEGTCVDRSATESRVEIMERNMEYHEAKVQRLQRKLSKLPMPEEASTTELCDRKIDRAKAQLRAMEAQVQESKKRYEEATKTAKDDPESNAKPGHEEPPGSTDSAMEALALMESNKRTTVLPCGHIMKFVKVPPALKHLVTGPRGETLQKLQEDTSTTITEKSGGFEATGSPNDIERFEARVQQLLGEPVPTAWMREYEDLVDAHVLFLPRSREGKNEEDARSAESSGPVNRYFFLMKTKAMGDLLDKAVNVDVLQEETNVVYEKRRDKFVVRMNGQEADVRNAFCKLLATIRAYTRSPAIHLEVPKNQIELASQRTAYWRAKLELLEGTYVDRSATKIRIDSIRKNVKHLEAKAECLQRLSKQSIPETGELCVPNVDEAKARLRELEAKAEESKKRYEEAMQTHDPEDNAGPGHKDVSSSTRLATVPANTQHAAIQLEVLNNRFLIAGVKKAYWRAKLELLEGTCDDRDATERKIGSMEQYQKNLEAKDQRLQLEQRLSEQSIPATRELCDPQIDKTIAQLRAMEAKAEELKKRYEKAMKTPEDDPESNAKPVDDDLTTSTDSATDELAVKVEKLRLALAQLQISHAGHHIDFWRAKATAVRTGDDAGLPAMLAHSVRKMDVLVKEAHRVEDKLNRMKHLLPGDSASNDDREVLSLRDQVLEAQLRLNALIERALVWQLRHNDARTQKLAREEKGQSQEQQAQAELYNVRMVRC